MIYLDIILFCFTNMFLSSQNWPSSDKYVFQEPFMTYDYKIDNNHLNILIKSK